MICISFISIECLHMNHFTRICLDNCKKLIRIINEYYQQIYGLKGSTHVPSDIKLNTATVTYTYLNRSNSVDRNFRMPIIATQPILQPNITWSILSPLANVTKTYLEIHICLLWFVLKSSRNFFKRNLSRWKGRRGRERERETHDKWAFSFAWLRNMKV